MTTPFSTLVNSGCDEQASEEIEEEIYDSAVDRDTLET
jgi:hypothetical protein